MLAPYGWTITHQRYFYLHITPHNISVILERLQTLYENRERLWCQQGYVEKSESSCVGYFTFSASQLDWSEQGKKKHILWALFLLCPSINPNVSQCECQVVDSILLYIFWIFCATCLFNLTAFLRIQGLWAGSYLNIPVSKKYKIKIRENTGCQSDSPGSLYSSARAQAPMNGELWAPKAHWIRPVLEISKLLLDIIQNCGALTLLFTIFITPWTPSETPRTSECGVVSPQRVLEKSSDLSSSKLLLDLMQTCGTLTLCITPGAPREI